MEAAWRIVPKREIFEHTRIAAMNFNSIDQLVHRVRTDDSVLKQAKKLLLMPDLLGYLLTGKKRSGYTEVTTTNLFKVSRQDWDLS